MRKYQRDVSITMAGYVIALLGVSFYVKHHPTHGALAYVLAVLPAIPIICMLGVVGIYLRDEKDEFLRWMMIRSMLWASGVILAVSTVTGFLETFTSFKTPPAYYVFVLFWVVFGAVQGIQQWQGRRADD